MLSDFNMSIFHAFSFMNPLFFKLCIDIDGNLDLLLVSLWHCMKTSKIIAVKLLEFVSSSSSRSCVYKFIRKYLGPVVKFSFSLCFFFAIVF